MSNWRKLISKQHKCVIHIFVPFSSSISPLNKINLCFKHNLQPFIIFLVQAFKLRKRISTIYAHIIYTCSTQRECYVSSNGKSFSPKNKSLFMKKKMFSTFPDRAVKLCSSITTIIFSSVSTFFLQNLIDLFLNLHLSLFRTCFVSI